MTEFWTTTPDAEQFTCTSADECIREYLSGHDENPGGMTTLYKWRRVPKPSVAAMAYYDEFAGLEGNGVLGELLDALDQMQELGNPDESTEPTQRMREAELEFIRVVLDEYKVWACEIVDHQVVNLDEWAAKQSTIA